MPRKRDDMPDALDREKEPSPQDEATKKGVLETKPVLFDTQQRIELIYGVDDGKSSDEDRSFYNVNHRELDKGLSDEQLKEWEAIYASFRSVTPLKGTVIGVDVNQLKVTDPITRVAKHIQVMCLVVMDYRVKVIIPQSEIWFDNKIDIPDYMPKQMIGAKIDYTITHIDRIGECALASRRIALRYERHRFFKDRKRTEPGQIQICNVLAVGPSRVIVECNGFDLQLRNYDLSYTAIDDLRKEYRPGQELKAKLIEADQRLGTLEVSIKAVNPNPFIDADKRHPVDSTRKAIISGTYAGGFFCTLTDDTTCLCLYSPGYFKDELYIGDSVLIAIKFYDYDRKLIYGRLLSKI